MKSIVRLSSALALVLAACSSGTAPQGALNGTWNTPTVPSGGGIEVQITTSGSSLTGSGTTYGLQHAVLATYSIKGTYKNAVITWTMTYQSGGSGKFRGNLVGSNTIQGTWTPPAPDSAYAVTLLRQ